MKKTRKLFVIFLSISLVLFSNFTSVFALTNVIEDNRAQDKIITSIEASTRNGTEISKNDSVCSIEYFTDPEGNLFGPADYCVDGESMYILDSSDNTIMKYINGSLTEIIELNEYGIIGVNIAAYKESIYVLDNSITVYQLGSKGNLVDLGIRESLLSEGISDFRIIEGFLYICVAEDEIVTYKFDLSNIDNVTVNRKFKGMIFDSDTIFYSEAIAEEGKSLGNGISVNIVHLDTNKTEIFDIYSNYTALGAQYLGEDSCGNYRILFFEISQNEDFTLATATSLRIIDKKGNLIGIRELNKQVKSIPNQVKAIDGQVFFLNTLVDCVQILKLNDPETNTVGNYKSTLDSIVKPDISNKDNNSELLRNSSITRTEIMSIATSYHTSFSWTCTSTNLAYLEYWEKPSYVSTAGTYTCMPYRWGGFDNQSGYNTKLTNGYRVGQTATTYLWNTGGLDCAGYVSRCWELDQHYYTGALGGISSEIDFEDLQSGDALNSTDHVMLFDYYNSSNGTYILYECTTTSNYDRVSHTVRTAASIESTYTPIKYDYTTD